MFECLFTNWKVLGLNSNAIENYGRQLCTKDKNNVPVFGTEIHVFVRISIEAKRRYTQNKNSKNWVKHAYII